jgi:hypothetical protein
MTVEKWRRGEEEDGGECEPPVTLCQPWGALTLSEIPNKI